MPTLKSIVSTRSLPVRDHLAVLTLPYTDIMIDVQMDQDKLKTENANLMNAFREKSRKHQQTQELYDRLKRKEMTAATQSAAFESVDEVLEAASSRQGIGSGGHAQPFQRPPSVFEQYMTGQNLPNGVHGHGRDSGNFNGPTGRMMPPPLHRPSQGLGAQAFRSGT